LKFVYVGLTGAQHFSPCDLSSQLHRRYGFVGVGLTSVHYVVLQFLWTTAPTIGLDFVGSSGALSPVQPTPFEASSSVQPVLALTTAGSARRLNRRHSN